MKNITQYEMIGSSDHALVLRLINDQIKKGWELYGSPFSYVDSTAEERDKNGLLITKYTIFLCQAVTK